MRIVFMGTPDFAVPSLKSLIEAGHEVCGVFTQPDKPKGRGYALTPPPVKVLAAERGIPVYQPATLRKEEAVELVRALQPELIAVVAYGKILPKAILDIPGFGCVNVHGSLLPKYRGAAPIQWSVINGDRYAGVTTMFMAEGLDTGDMLLSQSTEIGPDETSGELYGRLSEMGARLLVKTVQALRDQTDQRIPQNDADSSYAPMLTKELARIDWTKPAQGIHNLVRGLSPWPVAFTAFHNKKLKIHKTALCPCGSGEPGKAAESDGRFVVSCGGGSALELLEVQLQGGKKMSGRDFLRGHPVGENTVLQ
ncbi:MAG: methionyl-tRNA formyltransferase [Clostridiales bacterium]|nr:methionyl-tRNA formyltransferase [Clostridiales bacterium]